MTERGGIDFAVLEQAAEWFARLGVEPVAAGDRERWQAWLAASPEHHRAWRRVERIGGEFAAMPAAPALRALRTAGGASRRRLLKTLALAGLALGSGWQLREGAAWQRFAADHGTGRGERRGLVLADGSRLWLNSDSALDVRLDTTARALHLRRGELLIDTAADARPLTVYSAQGAMRALGTRFSVRVAGEHTRLAVFEGRVAVRNGAGERVLPAGRQLVFGRADAGAEAPAERRHEAWSRGLLVAENLPLEAFFAELARQHRVHFAVAPAVASLRLVGSYPLDDLDAVFAALEETLPVTVRRRLPWWVSVAPRA